MSVLVMEMVWGVSSASVGLHVKGVLEGASCNISRSWRPGRAVSLVSKVLWC